MVRAPSLAFAVSLAASLPLAAQGRAAPYSGVELRLELVETPAWSLEERTGTFVNRSATYDAGPVGRLGLAVAPVRMAALFGAVEWNGGGLGDSSGFTAAEIGLEGRLPTGCPLVPRASLALGRLSESGGVWFGYVSAGLGVQLHLGRHLSLALDVRRLEPLSAHSRASPGRGPSPTASVDASMTRLALGLGLRL